MTQWKNELRPINNALFIRMNNNGTEYLGELLYTATTPVLYT